MRTLLMDLVVATAFAAALAKAAPGIVCAISKDDSAEESGAGPVMQVRDNDLMVHMQEFLPMRRNRQLFDGPSQTITFAGVDAVFPLRSSRNEKVAGAELAPGPDRYRWKREA